MPILNAQKGDEQFSWESACEDCGEPGYYYQSVFGAICAACSEKRVAKLLKDDKEESD